MRPNAGMANIEEDVELPITQVSSSSYHFAWLGLVCCEMVTNNFGFHCKYVKLVWKRILKYNINTYTLLRFTR